MSSLQAERRRIKRKYLIASYVTVVVYVAGIGVGTYLLWRWHRIRDAASLTAYATAILAISTIVLFAATAVLAAATIELGQAERDAQRLETEKYEEEKDARREEIRRGEQQAKVYSLQIEDLGRRLAAQERAQAELIDMETIVITLLLPGGTSRRCLVVRVTNHSHLPIRLRGCVSDLPDGTRLEAQAGRLDGEFSTVGVREFKSPEEPRGRPVKAGDWCDFAFVEGVDATHSGSVLFEFEDAVRRGWRLDDQYVLTPSRSSEPPADR